ncbi:S-adenosyl-L-methionine-dependent methyltransferase [Neohortaea acidophila]|uniref:S-adenosyl-L-methionine-dependent methyltransferase n=1 Tax=Neohortaea acidophila TaxID=245834 RepID=A0A6A6PKZ9_9PEZI|nr:S-adenosyl-L-methionine-dependent methyltransferase [Neohortaea acidophila]KAF2480163.1 S-adenosyl-L-methionine-dependent methyltransferase [Neohortaea acidophila]
MQSTLCLRSLRPINCSRMARTKQKGRRGRGGHRGGGRGGGGGGGGSQRPPQDNRRSEEIVKQNEKFQRYYNTLDIVPDSTENQAFWASLRRELPNSFRFTGSKGHALGVRNNLVERFFPIISKIEHDGRPVEIPTQIPWFPDGLAYTMKTPKNVVRKYEPFKEFQRFLVSETGVGNISRQEHVSMIPPLLLDIRPEHTVLDLCAAPGSKSAQLIEAIHAGEEERVLAAIAKVNGKESASNGAPLAESEQYDSGRSTGLLVANDVNYQRAQMLVHQVKRLNSPNLIVTNHDATMFPSIELPSLPAAPGQPKKGRYLKFDRILADVPCSGDGTCRKNPSIWKDWSPQNGLGLYITQVRILTRALQMLKTGGRVVYSTCSLNPVENEAVVSSAIERCGGVAKVRLVDCSDKLPSLIRSQGLPDWNIMSRNGNIYESYPEAEQYETEDSKIVPGMFPPGPEEQIPLQHCMRVYPHQQDTGGFFIAVMEKLSEIRAKPEAESKSMKKDWKFQGPPAAVAEAKAEPETLVGEIVKEIDQHQPPTISEADTDSAAARQNAAPEVDAGVGTKRKVAEELQPEPRKRRRDDGAANEESFKYLDPNHPELESIYSFYELTPDFPRDRFLVRNPAGDPVKGIYYSSQLAKEILVTNEGRGMKFVHAGVKMFMKQDSQGQDICRWRIQTEGLPIIEGWVGESRVIRLRKKSTLRKLLVEMFPKLKVDENGEGGWKALDEVGKQVLDIGMGCCVLRVEASEGPDGFEEPLTLPLWRSMHSLNLMLPKEERKAMLLRIFNEDTELVNHDMKGGKAANGEAAVKGSVAAEEDAVEVERKIEADETIEVEELGEDAKLGEQLAADQDALAAEDIVRAEELEKMETEETKVADAMPERAGEGDEANTTV